MRWLLLVITYVILNVSTVAWAHSATIGIFREPTGYTCGIPDNAPGMVPAYVVVYFADGVIGTTFSAPVPECLKEGLWLSDAPVFPVYEGDSQTGIQIGFGECKTGSFHILTMNLYVQGLTEGCCPFPILPDPNNALDGVEFFDCSFNSFKGQVATSFVTRNGEWTGPSVTNLHPSDGAQAQPLDTKLSWDVSYCSCGIGDYWDAVYFGTTADPPLVADYLWHTYDPGPLQPGVKYYWKVRASDSDAGSTTTPVFSFTTEEGTPVENTTWGRIKGLYGD
jgi:hypothetical protein